MTIFVFYILPFFINSNPERELSSSFGIEICDNGIDDDGDGLIDLLDPDCECTIIEPESLIPNPSFEEMNCCPDNRSQLDCASSWIQASEPTTDYLNTCGWLGWPEFPPPLPFPDGNGIMGFRDGRIRNGVNAEPNWKEYAGACLLSPLIAGTTYRFEFNVGFVNSSSSPPINISFFGTTDCKFLPFGKGNEKLGCPTNGPNWKLLGSSFINGGTGHKWIKTFIEVKPTENIYAIAIGPDCPEVASVVPLYYYFDNLILADLRQFQLNVTEVSHPCQSDYSLKVEANAEFQYQWYKDGIALIGETNHQLEKMYGYGNYQVRLMDGISCRLSHGFDVKPPTIYSHNDITLCKEDTYIFGQNIISEPGNYIDTFFSYTGCDSVVTLNVKKFGINADTVEAKIFKGETYSINQYAFESEGNYMVKLQSFSGCDSLVILSLSLYNIYIPNIFTPNSGNENAFFSIYDYDGLIIKKVISIYDRWGSLIYVGDNWNGETNGIISSSGVYAFNAQLTMNDGKTRSFLGSVTLIR